MKDFGNNPASINKKIPVERLFDTSTIEQCQITEVTWVMSIKPGIRNVEAYKQERVRMEEIEVLIVLIQELLEEACYRELLSQIHEKIQYPCVVYLVFKNKYNIATRYFIDPVRKTSGVVLRGAFISAWIRDPECSEKTKGCSDKVYDILMNGEGSIKDLYFQISSTISECTPNYIGSREHLRTIIYDITGRKPHPIEKDIDSAKRYILRNGKSKYEKKRKTNQYTYSYEYEDIWYAFMNDEQIKQVINKRHYRDIEDLIYSIDTRYSEYSAW